MRFLCLHGLGTNSDVLKAQTAALRYGLSETGNHEYLYIDGSILWPPARGIEEVFGQHIDTYSYFEADGAHAPGSIHKAVVDLASYVCDHGPFDGVIGFSQGAVLAVTLLIASNTATAGTTLSPFSDKNPPFRCGIFLCGGSPFDWHGLEQGSAVQLDSGNSASTLINIPVVNCWAHNDLDYPGMGPSLSSLCNPTANIEVIHGAGHGVPSEGEDIEKLVAASRSLLSSI